MYCRKCGTQNDDNAWKCIKCGEILQMVSQSPQQPRVNIPNYLAQAILVTIFCCVPFGIPAIVFAAQVNGKIATGDIEGATASSKKAKMWCWLSFGTGLTIIAIYFLFILLGALAGI